MAAPALVEIARGTMEEVVMRSPHQKLLPLVTTCLCLLSSPGRSQDGSPLASITAPVAQVSTSGAVPVLTGTWAHEFVTTSVSDVPIIGSLRATTRTLLRLEIVQSGQHAEIRSQVCSVDVGGGGGVIRTIVPDAFVDSLAEQNVSVTVRSDDGRPTIFGWEHTEVVGAQLVNDEDDTLPTSASDARVVDADNDGEPGVTIRVRGLVNGEIYLVQRGWSRLRTSRVTGDEIVGNIDWTTEQHIVGATLRVLQTAPPTWPDPSERRNFFLAVRVDDGTTCDDIIRDDRDLFDR